MKLAGNIRASLFYKLFLVFLLIIVAFYSFSLYTNIQGAKNLEREVAQSTLANVRFLSNILEEDILRINQAKRQFINDYELQKISIAADTMSDYQKADVILKLQYRLTGLKMISKYVKNVNVYIPVLGRTVSIDSSISDLQKDQYESIVKGFNKDGGLIVFLDDRLYLNMAYPYGEYIEIKDRLPIYLVTVELSKEELYQSLLSMFSNVNGGTVLFSNRTGWVLSTDPQMWNEVKDYFTGQNAIQFSDDQGMQKVRVNNEELWLMGVYSDYLDTYLFTYIPAKEVLGPYFRYRHWIWFLSVFSILIIFLYTYWVYRMLAVPLNKFVMAFKEVERGNLDFSILHSNNDEFGYLYGQFNMMLNKLKSYIKTIYGERIRAQQAELKQLQYQINPHFLYNSLFLIYRMAKDGDCENIIKLSKHLGDYYKYINHSKSDLVSLQSEINHSKTYVEIQTIRFGDRIIVEFDNIPSGLENMMVPPLIIQPLIENAYQHGLKTTERGGKLSVRMGIKGKFLCITVEDNGSGMEPQKLSTLQKLLECEEINDEVTTGIVNVHRRLRIKYGSDSGIQVSIGSMGGIRVDMNIMMEGDKHV